MGDTPKRKDRRKSLPSESIRIIVPAPVYQWLESHAEARYKKVGNYVRDLVISAYRQEQHASEQGQGESSGAT